MMQWTRSALVAATGIALAGCTEARSPAVAGESAAITNGTAAASDDAVVAISGRTVLCGVPPPTLCTGTLVSPRVVVTAAHCLDDFDAASIEVFFGADITGPGDVIYAQDAQTHPGYDADTLANDLAVIRLAVAVDTVPVPLLAAMDEGFVGTSARVVGFGRTGPAAPTTSGIRRTGDAEITSVDATTFAIAPAPSMSCQGDSGGPVLVTLGDQEVLAGVTSWGDAGCSELAVNTRADVFLADFVAVYIDAAAGVDEAADGGPPRPGTIDVCAEPCTGEADCPEGTACELAIGGARCGVPGLGNGQFADLCADSRDCGDDSCAARERAGRPECRCYVRCATTPRPDAGPCTTDCVDDPGGCGCRTAGGRSSWWFAVLAGYGLIGLARVRRRRRPGRVVTSDRPR